MEHQEEYERYLEHHKTYNMRFSKRVRWFIRAFVFFLILAVTQFINLFFFDNELFTRISEYSGIAMNLIVIGFCFFNWRAYVEHTRESEEITKKLNHSLYEKAAYDLNLPMTKPFDHSKARKQISLMYLITIVWCLIWLGYLIYQQF